jgi:Ca2+-binding RTX toxin-like protein
VAAADKAVLKGGASADTLIAARNAMLTGAGGKDVFEFTTPGSAKTPDNDTVADFAHGVDKIALSEKGFALGAKPVAATLFAAGPKGSFTSLSQRFAYDTATGQLFYDAHGSATPNSRLAIAVLAHHPTLAASDLRFVA